MKNDDDTSQESLSPDTNFHPTPEVGQESRGPDTLRAGLPNRPRPPVRSGRGLYITAIVLAIVLLILISLYVFLSLTRKGPSQGTTAAPIAVFHTAACPFKLGTGIQEGQEVRCGFLTVPEDPARPQGQTIQLAVAIFKGSTPAASSTPLFYLQGGPGGALLSDLATYISSTNLALITQGHDLVLLDQRGTGYSKPALTCKELTDLQYATLDQNISREKSITLYAQAARACHDRLLKAGIHLNTYTSIANATDVHELVHALGYQQVDLYGVSYGTLLAQTMMRLFPADIRSVVLDSTVPTQENLYNNLPADTQRVFDVFFQGCAANIRCHTVYPQLQSQFYKLVSKLNVTPATFQDPKHGPVLLNGDGLASWLFQALYATSLIPALPVLITQVNQGNFTSFSQIYGLIAFNDTLSLGMYYGVQCGEQMPFTTLQEMNTTSQVLRPEIRPEVLMSIQADYNVCQFWGQTPVAAAQKLPIQSALPTLILSGEYDPITPPANGQLVEQTLSHGYYFLFPGTGHGAHFTNTCPDSIIAAFLLQPTVKPASACIATMNEPAFQ